MKKRRIEIEADDDRIREALDRPIEEPRERPRLPRPRPVEQCERSRLKPAPKNVSHKVPK